MKVQYLSFVFLLFFNMGSFAWNIFGEDQRQLVSSEVYPWSTIGRLETGCTGTLVGRNIVLTAGHCVRSDSQYFYPHRLSDITSSRSRIKKVIKGAADWALLLLEDDIGDSYGWMEVADSLSAEAVNLVGYSSDIEAGKVPSVHLGCSIRKRAFPYLLHDCDCTRGSSGGPLFVQRSGHSALLIGLNIGEFRKGESSSLTLPSGFEEAYANVALSTIAFRATLKKILSGHYEYW